MAEKPSRDILLAARAMIPTPRHWCRYGLQSKDFSRYCLAGAVMVAEARLAEGRPGRARSDRPELCALADAAGVSPEIEGIDYWNDDHTHAEVMALFDQALSH